MIAALPAPVNHVQPAPDSTADRIDALILLLDQIRERSASRGKHVQAQAPVESVEQIEGWATPEEISDYEAYLADVDAEAQATELSARAAEAGEELAAMEGLRNSGSPANDGKLSSHDAELSTWDAPSDWKPVVGEIYRGRDGKNYNQW